MRYMIIFFLLLTLTSVADDERDNHYYSKDLKYLKLTKSQKESIKKILQKYRRELKKFRQQKKEIQKQKKRLFLKDKLNVKKLTFLNTKLYKISSKIEEKFLFNMHKILSKKQRKKFINFIDEWEIE